MRLFLGDCLEVMRQMEADSVDTIITDPPYGLEFMGKDWDHGSPGIPFWREALRVAKPGALLLAFGGTRTHHRLMCAIEDAGWEIRDTIMWLYGSGFPKSMDVGKAIDKDACRDALIAELGRKPTKAEFKAAWKKWREVVGKYQPPDGRPRPNSRRSTGDVYGTHGGPLETPITAPATDAAALWDGWGTALKPAWEPIIVAMKPRDGTFANNALTWGVAGLWVDGSRITTKVLASERRTSGRGPGKMFGFPEYREGERHNPKGRWPANLLLSHSPGCDGQCVPGCAVRMLGEQSGERPSGNLSPGHKRGDGPNVPYGGGGVIVRHYGGDTGTAARFFYCAKASRCERNAGLEGMEERPAGALKSGDGGWSKEEQRGRKPRHNQQMKARNHHPTVKPLALMEYLCRLTRTPTGGVVLDPFMGSGTTGMAAVNEGREFIGIEIDPEYFEIAYRRIKHAMAERQPEQLSFMEAVR